METVSSVKSNSSRFKTKLDRSARFIRFASSNSKFVLNLVNVFFLFRLRQSSYAQAVHDCVQAGSLEICPSSGLSVWQEWHLGNMAKYANRTVLYPLHEWIMCNDDECTFECYIRGGEIIFSFSLGEKYRIIRRIRRLLKHRTHSPKGEQPNKPDTKTMTVKVYLKFYHPSRPHHGLHRAFSLLFGDYRLHAYRA